MAGLVIKFKEAQRNKCKASILIEGLSGLGKSGLALSLGRALAGNWESVFDIDTENKSVNLFAGIDGSIGEPFGAFKEGQLTPDIGYRPSNYLAFRQAAIDSGAKVVIKDSISHAWQYKGGVLDLVNDAKSSNARYSKDSYAAWSDPTVAKEKNELLALLRDERVHVICTVRVKEKMEYGTDSDGKSKLVSLGEQQIQQADLKYEPDLVLHMVSPGSNRNGNITHPVARVVKTRYAIFERDKEYEFTPALMEQLRKYLEEGVDPATLLEEQRQDYIIAIKGYLDRNPSAINIWKVLKKDSGFGDTVLEEMPLATMKEIYMRMVN